MTTDLVSDMLTRIRNAYKAKHRYTIIPFTNLNKNIAFLLKKEGFLKEYELNKNEQGHRLLILYLKYKYVGVEEKPKPILTGIKRISKPGMRVYSAYKDIPTVLGNLGIAIISTSEGLMTNFEAKTNKKGGEIICYVW